MREFPFYSAMATAPLQAQKLYSATGPMTAIVQASVRRDDRMPSRNRLCLRTSFCCPAMATEHLALLFSIRSIKFPLHPRRGLRSRRRHGYRPAPRVRGDRYSIGIPIGGNLAVYYDRAGGHHVSLASGSPPPKAGQSVTLTAHVTASPTEPGTPGGTITFKDGTHFLGTVTMSRAPPVLRPPLPPERTALWLNTAAMRTSTPITRPR